MKPLYRSETAFRSIIVVCVFMCVFLEPLVCALFCCVAHTSTVRLKADYHYYYHLGSLEYPLFIPNSKLGRANQSMHEGGAGQDRDSRSFGHTNTQNIEGGRERETSQLFVDRP